MTSTAHSDTVSSEILGDIGLIRLDNPPVNAASHALRSGITAAVQALEPQVKAIAIYGAGRAFVAGADIKEFGKPLAAPSLPDVCLALENAKVPVVAVVHGPTLGGGLELAMSAHARVGLPSLKTGLPEVSLGVMPGAGGTQRGPRLIGIRNTLDLATTGRHIGAQEALEVGLIDKLADGDPKTVAIGAAQDAISGSLGTQITAQVEVTADDSALAEYRNKLAKSAAHLFSPHKIVEAVALSTGAFEPGMAAERAMFQECIQSPQRAGLIHAFFSERAVTKIPEASAIPRSIDEVGVVGGGTMGSGIATACLLAGLRVVLMETNPEGLDRARATITKNLDGAVKRGKLSPGGHQAALDRLKLTTRYIDFVDADLVIEAVFEDMAVKKQVFRNLDLNVKPGGILATNTSYLDVNEIAATSARPNSVIGLHFFSPAHVMKLLEVVVADKTAPDVVATGFALAKRLRKIAVRAGVCDGFIGNRVLSHTRKVADYLMMDGATPAEIDAALAGFGFAMGPFAVLDLAGLDIGWANRKRLAPTRPEEERYIEIADRICENGWFGRKTGQGFYLYPGGEPNPEVLAIIEAERAKAGITPRGFDADQIVDRYMTAMVSEAVQLLSEGIALRPIDVDAVLLNGYGFPRHRGGPLHFADQVGAKVLVDRIATYAKEDAHYWRVPELLRQMAETDGSFGAMNR